MKTTIDIADDILSKAKNLARREHRTLREVVEESLRRRLSAESPTRPYRLRHHTFKGKGLQPGVAEGDWETIRDAIYGPDAT